jgi:hypothetical protein
MWRSLDAMAGNGKQEAEGAFARKTYPFGQVFYDLRKI